MISFLSLKYLTVFFSMELLLGYLSIFSLEVDSQMGKGTYAMKGVHSKLTCAYEGVGVKFFLFWCVRTN